MWECFKVSSVKEKNLHSARSWDMCKWNSLVYKLCILFKLIYPSPFSFLHRYNDRRYPENNSKYCDSAIMFEIELLRYLEGLAVCLLESLSCTKQDSLNDCFVCSGRRAIFNICFLVIGSIKYGCCAHVVEIIQSTAALQAFSLQLY